MCEWAVPPLDARRKQAEQTVSSEPVSSTLHSLCISSCLHVPALCEFLRWSAVDAKWTFSTPPCLVNGVYHNVRALTTAEDFSWVWRSTQLFLEVYKWFSLYCYFFFLMGKKVMTGFPVSQAGLGPWACHLCFPSIGTIGICYRACLFFSWFWGFNLRPLVW